ncbi:MAG: PAS domain-containing protein [Spirochaetia bacterium]|nr:PAS domain-containing protein [Spirochaetia bacterium]
MNILIVDDHAINRKLLRVTLEAENITVLEAADGLKALDVLHHSKVDAIISDILMPRMDGYRLCIEIRRSEKLREIPFIAYTSTYTSPTDEKAAIGFGADKFLKRPASTAVLLKAISEAIADSKRIPHKPLDTSELWNDYNARLVEKLEKKNQDLLLAQEKLNHLVSHSPAILYMLDIQGNEATAKYVSENIERILGYSVGEALEPEWWNKGLHPDDRTRVMARVEPGILGPGYSLEYRFKHKDGSYRWIEDSNHILDRSDSPGRQAIGVWTDISQRRAADDKLRESEARFRQVVEHIKEVFWISDVATRTITYVSPGFERIWGRPIPDIYQESEFLETIHPEDRDRIGSVLQDQQGGFNDKFRIIHPDGLDRWIHARVFPIPDESGAVYRTAGMAIDITEQMRMEEHMRRTQRLESIGTLASGIAHDLNNVLTPILMGVEMLKVNVTDPEDRDLIGSIERSAIRGGELIRQILTFARGSNGMRGPLDVSLVVKEITKILRDTFPRDIQITTEIPPTLALINGDATEVYQVIMNLCVNARDAMPEGGSLGIQIENLTIDKSAGRILPGVAPGHYVVISVSDTGIGISPDRLDKIFDPFYTTKEPGKGTGLGLSTLIGIVKNHTGFVEVQSEPGKGTKFQIYLPTIQSKESNTIQEATK